MLREYRFWHQAANDWQVRDERRAGEGPKKEQTMFKEGDEYVSKLYDWCSWHDEDNIKRKAGYMELKIGKAEDIFKMALGMLIGVFFLAAVSSCMFSNTIPNQMAEYPAAGKVCWVDKGVIQSCWAKGAEVTE